jgi:flagellar M-ring protein FliF
MDELKRLLGGLSGRQKWIIAGGAFMAVLVIWQGVRWNRERDLRPLFLNLSAEDAGAVVERLRTANVPYSVSDGGTVMVPSSRVAELRLEMATSGLPRTGRIGFELFDRTNLGSTEFAEHVNFRRAIEGELERSVMSIAAVERARVHVTFAKESVFLESRQPAKASVMVKLRPGMAMPEQSIAAVRHLAASAVEGLLPEAVSVLDMSGNLLGKPRAGVEGESGAPGAALEYRQGLEREMAVKLRATLDPLLGAERYRAGVSIECDMTSGEQSEESFDPARSVMASSQRTEDTSTPSGAAAGAGGVPGTASNLPRPPPRSPGSSAGTARRTESIAYQTSRVVRHTKLPQGAVKRVSVAILVDHTARWEGSGAAARRVLEAPPPEKLKVVKDVAAGVVGFQPERGDQILVETLPFDATLNAPPPEAAPPAAPPAGRFTAPEWLAPLAGKAPPAVWYGAAGALAIVIAVAAYWLMRRLRSVRASAVAPAALPGGFTPAQLSAQSAGFEDQALAQLHQNQAERAKKEIELLNSLKLPPPTKKGEVLRKYVTEQSTADPARTAQLVRTWLNEERGRV